MCSSCVFYVWCFNYRSLSKDDNADTSSVNSNNSSNNSSIISNTNTGQSNSGLKIDLNDSKFSNLAVVGGWMNYTEQGLLLLGLVQMK